MATYGVLEHREGRTTRWLRENRLRIAFLVALAETVLVVANVVQWRWALLVAGLVFAFHFALGRRARFGFLRQASRAAAVSQTLPVLVPLIALVVSTLVVLAIVAVAFVVLALVVFGRR